MCQDAYQRLAVHLSVLGMGLPNREDLLPVLRENLSPEEAEILLLLPTRVMPLEVTGLRELAADGLYSKEELENTLDSLADRGMVYTGLTEKGEKGYALQQVGFGFPQTFLWTGEDTPHARNMANLTGKYFNREVLRESYGSSKTKPFRYIPTAGTTPPDQAILPYHLMATVLDQAKTFAVAHCACRVHLKLRGGRCDHPEEVCLKFDEWPNMSLKKAMGRKSRGKKRWRS